MVTTVLARWFPFLVATQQPDHQSHAVCILLMHLPKQIGFHICVFVQQYSQYMLCERDWFNIAVQECIKEQEMNFGWCATQLLLLMVCNILEWFGGTVFDEFNLSTV